MSATASLVEHPQPVNALATGAIVPAPAPDPFSARRAANAAEIAWVQRLLAIEPAVTLRAAIVETLADILAARLTIGQAAELLERIQGAGDRLHGVLVKMLGRANMTRGVLANIERKQTTQESEHDADR